MRIFSIFSWFELFYTSLILLHNAKRKWNWFPKPHMLHQPLECLDIYSIYFFCATTPIFFILTSKRHSRSCSVLKHERDPCHQQHFFSKKNNIHFLYESSSNGLAVAQGNPLHKHVLLVNADFYLEQLFSFGYIRTYIYRQVACVLKL